MNIIIKEKFFFRPKNYNLTKIQKSRFKLKLKFNHYVILERNFNRKNDAFFILRKHKSNYRTRKNQIKEKLQITSEWFSNYKITHAWHKLFTVYVLQSSRKKYINNLSKSLDKNCKVANSHYFKFSLAFLFCLSQFCLTSLNSL